MMTFLVGFMIFMAVYLIGWTATTIWLGLSHKKHEDVNAIMWMVVNLISPYVGVIGYLINCKVVKSRERKSVMGTANSSVENIVVY